MLNVPAKHIVCINEVCKFRVFELNQEVEKRSINLTAD